MDGWGSFVLLVSEGGEFVALQLENCLSFPTNLFQSYILITEVLLSKDDDAPLSGGLKSAAFGVYGITAIIMGGYTALEFARP